MTSTTVLRLHLPRALARPVPVAVAAFVLSAVAAAQGETGFLRGQGKADVVVSYTLDEYDKFWVGSSKVAMAGVGEVQRHTYTLYSAYGIRDDADLILKASYAEAESDGAGNAPDEDDFQDLTLAAKWRVFEQVYERGSELSLAVLPGVKLPMADYENNSITAVGDGQVDLQFRLVGQYRLANGAFAALETGYDRRNGAPDDEVPVHFTVGGTVLDGLTLSAFWSDVNSLGGTDIGPPGTNDFPTNEEDFTRTGVSAYYRLGEHLGLTGSWRTTTDGRNTGDVDGYSVGLVVRVM